MKSKWNRILCLCMVMVSCLLTTTGCSKKSYLDASTLLADDEGVTYTEDSLSIDDTRTVKLFKDCEVKEGEGFVVSYTVQGNDPEYLWVNSGGLYVELDDDVEEEIEGNGSKLWHNLLIFHDPWGQMHANACVWVIENSPYAQKGEGAFYKTEMPFAVSSNPVSVTIVYYNEAYYIELDHSYTVKLTADMTPENEERIHVEKLFAAGNRKLGFRTGETGATFSKINYSIGNEAALEAIKEMKIDE